MEFSTIAAVDLLVEREARDRLRCRSVRGRRRQRRRCAPCPALNGSYRDGRYELYSRINIGVTIVDEDVYATPTIFDADDEASCPTSLWNSPISICARTRTSFDPGS